MFSVWLTVFSFFFFHLLQPMWVSYLFSQPGKILHLVLKFSRYSQRSVKNLPWRAESGMYWNILGVERCLKIPGLLIGPLWDLGFIALTWDSVWLCGLVLLFISYIQVCSSLSSSVRLLQDSDNMINVSSFTHIWYMSLSKQEWACCCFYHYSYYEYETWLAHGYWGKGTSNSWSTFALDSGLNASWKLDQYILPALLFPARVTWLITGFLLLPFLRKLKMWCCSCLLCKALKPMGEAALTS